MNKQVVVDTSPIVAILSPSDNYHNICVETLKTLPPPLFTTWAVITEVLWLIRSNKKAIETLFTMIDGQLIAIKPLQNESIMWLKTFMLNYHDMGVQIADASLCYLAESQKIDTVFTLDRKDFSIYRINGKKSLDIIP